MIQNKIKELEVKLSKTTDDKLKSTIKNKIEVLKNKYVKK